MSAQTSYRFGAPMGSAGGIVDLAPYEVDTFLNEENTGSLKFGVGVVKSATKPGVCVKLPGSTNVAADFEGIVVNNRTTEHGLEGGVAIRKGAACGVMRYGKIYGLLAADAAPAYGDDVYLVVSGTEAGCFTEDDTEGVAIAGKFRSAKDSTTGVAVIELFNAPQPVVAEEDTEDDNGSGDNVGGGSGENLGG